MSVSNKYQNVSYGLSQSLLGVPGFPIVSKRDPTASDMAPLGTLWVNKSANNLWIISSIVANVATWVELAIQGGGGGDVFNAITVNGLATFNAGILANAGAHSITFNTTDNAAAAFSVSTNGGTAETIVITNAQGTGAGAIHLASTAGGVSLTSGAAGISAVAAAGPITLNSGVGLVSISTDASATTIDIGTGAAVVKTIAIGGTGANVITIGNTQTGGSISLGAAMTTGTLNLGGTGAAIGNIVIGGGTGAQTINIGNSTGGKDISIGTGAGVNLVEIGSANGGSSTTIQAGTQGVATIAPFFRLNNTVNIYEGAGAPDNGLALEAGDLYINTTASTTTTRLYIATGAGAWTYFTTNA